MLLECLGALLIILDMQEGCWEGYPEPWKKLHRLDTAPTTSQPALKDQPHKYVILPHISPCF